MRQLIIMKQRKRDKDVAEVDKNDTEPIATDHELFLQAFEKPTQIYRYLRARNVSLPIFLHRCLSFMKKRSSRTNKRRLTFSIDSMLKDAESRQRRLSLAAEFYRPDYMNISFTQFSSNQVGEVISPVDVDVLLLKNSANRRKDVSASTETHLGSVAVPTQPSPTTDHSRVVSVGSENFAPSNGHSAGRSYVLFIRATSTRQGPGKTGPVMNGYADHAEPQPKRARLSRQQESASPSLTSPTPTVYSAQLVIYDKHKRCQLMDGEYELSLIPEEKPATRRASWETVYGGQTEGPFDQFNRQPIIKFRLTWTRTPAGPTSRSCTNNADTAAANGVDVFHDLLGITATGKNSSPNRPINNNNTIVVNSNSSVIYQFSYNNYLRQQTEARVDFHCPWCMVNCLDLYSLLKHLRLSHARFNFSYTPSPIGAVVDVSVNDCYDGGYVGNPQDTQSHLGYAFCRHGPVRRTPVTHVIVYRPHRPCHNLSEFMEYEETETIRQKQIIQGHNRLYYHTVTNRPIKPQEIEMDSEGENDPEWLRQKTVLMIDEFTDVNDGEKEIMKMWNLHVMRQNYIGDCQLAHACKTFIEDYGPVIRRQNLYRNCILHLVNLNDNGLVTSDTVFTSAQQLAAIDM